MQTNQQWFLDFMGQPNTQFTIPSYQRVYSWFKNQCEELWEDIVHCGKLEVSHYMSTTLFLDAGTTQSGTRKLDIIDGQQRIATTSIILTALRDYMRETGAVLEGGALANQEEGEISDIDADALHNRFLIVQDGTKTETKIQLIGPDGTTFTALVLGGAMPNRISARVKENYDYFLSRMRDDGFDIQSFWNGLRELLIIAAELDASDKAQTIFECLNTKGIPLSAADLMRNYLLVGKTRAEQQRLYLEYWQPMEIMFRDDQLSSGSLKLNTGLRMWLTIRFKRMCVADRSRTYYYFKIYMTTDYDGTVEELLDEMRSFSYLWAANYKLNAGRTHCSRFEWAKKGKGKTLVPRMERAADVMAWVRQKHGNSGDGQEGGEPTEGSVIIENPAEETMSPLYHGAYAPDASEAPLEETWSAEEQRKWERAPKKPYETMTFGQWGGEQILWRVLEREGDSVLLITENIIDCVPYHSYYVKTTWPDCDLRKWANSVFFEGAFSAEEASKVLANTTETPDDELWGTKGGGDCEDRVFLLSVEEALKYFDERYDRMAKPTDFARRWKVSVENGYCLWWLRSPGHFQGYASTVWPIGGVDTAGSGVGRPGVGFRPAIRVRL